MVKNDPEAAKHSLLSNTDSKISFNKQHDINNIILSENDNEKRLLWLKEQEKLHELDFEKCKLWQHDISQLVKEEDKFNSVLDPNGQMQYIYSHNGLLYLPICTPVDNLNFIQSKTCFQHQPVWYITSNDQNRTGYLTINNFIRDNSPIIACNLVSYAQLLPSNSLILNRKGNSFEIKNSSHLIIHDL